MVFALAGVSVLASSCFGGGQPNAGHRPATPATPATVDLRASEAAHPSGPVASAVQGLVSSVRAGLARRTVTPAAARQLVAELHDLRRVSATVPTGQLTKQQKAVFDLLSRSFYRYVARGEVEGAGTIDSLASSLAGLAMTLGTAVPTPGAAGVPPPARHSRPVTTFAHKAHSKQPGARRGAEARSGTGGGRVHGAPSPPHRSHPVIAGGTRSPTTAGLTAPPTAAGLTA
ncbi:MAG: hypothetical protein ACRDZX_18610, partial [Acidimicrobiales bacterium]